jgi:hypothetical protein
MKKQWLEGNRDMFQKTKTVLMLALGIFWIELGNSNPALSESCEKLRNQCLRKVEGDCDIFSGEQCGYYACMAALSQ